MFVFSKQHSWQNDEAVQQVLVFPDYSEKDRFDKEMLKRVEEARLNNQSIDYISDNGGGAIYKLRAIKQWNGKWLPVIRSGITGTLIYEDSLSTTNTPEEAVDIAMMALFKMIRQSFQRNHHDIATSWNSLNLNKKEL